MKAPYDILAIGQAENHSGFSRVFNSLFKHLSDRFKIVHFGINYKGKTIYKDWITEPNKIAGDKFGVEQLEDLILKYKPKLIFICHDYWLYNVHKKILGKHNLLHKTIFYCPVEGSVPDGHRAMSFMDIGKLVFYTHYGYSVFQDEMQYITSMDMKVLNERIDIIPHGLDTNLFYPINDGSENIRKKLFPHRPDLWNAFIILNANRNSPRKRIELTIQAFANFISNGPADCYLYLHMAKIDCGTDIDGHIARTGIKDKVIFTENASGENVVDDKTMNLIYNACDIGVNSSDGEGWGLIAFEHAATGKCQVVPNHTACKDLWREASMLIPADNSNTIDIKCLENCFSNLYHNRQLLKSMSDLSYKRSKTPCLSWSYLADRWAMIFEEMLK